MSPSSPTSSSPATAARSPRSSTPLRERIVEAAAELTVADGWAAVTMSRLAARVGVSRQTVYNEVGAKPELAQALVLWELGHFLEAVNAGFDERPAGGGAAASSGGGSDRDELVAAAEIACRNVFERAESNELMRAILLADHGADTELLPLLTTRADSLADAAVTVVEGRVAAYDHGLDDTRLHGLIDVLVRLVLSYVMRPQGSPAQMAELIAWTVARVLR